MSDGEDPRAELGLRTFERIDSGEDTEKHVAGEILRFSRALHPQVAGDDRRKIAVEAFERPRRADARRVQNVREAVADRQSGASFDSKSNRPGQPKGYRPNLPNFPCGFQAAV